MPGILDDFPTASDLTRQIMLTSSIVWQPNDLTQKDIDKWLNNFKGEVLAVEEEQILALWLLNHFVFYNENEIRHLCKLVHKEFVHRKATELNGTLLLEDRISSIHKKYKFHSMGDPSESGAYILYYFRQENNLPMNSFLRSLDTEKDIPEDVIFIDDNTLSGHEAYEFFSKLKPLKAKRTLLTLVATKSAIEKLKDIEVEVISTIVLEDRSRCFDPNSEVFIHHKRHLKDCERMVSHYGNKIAPGIPLGFRNTQLLFRFFYNTPNNSLPIFWGERNWYPIVRRYDKKKIYHFIEDERFV